MIITVWNILADGLSQGEFLTKNDSLAWLHRRNNIVAIMKSLITEGVDILATVENDHPTWLLKQLEPHWKAVIIFKTDGSSLKYTTCRKLRALDPTVTFKDEYASELAPLYDCTEDDLYRCDNTMTVYYNANKYQYGKNDTIAIERTPHDWFLLSMYNDLVSFTVGVAHLPSGESKSQEQRRVLAMTELFHACDQNTIIVMDSNTSVHYETEYQNMVTLSEVIKNHHYLVVNQDSGECFKLRHRHGDQPSKFGQLMFDTIDKILIPQTMTGTQIIYQNFLTPEQKQLAYLIRTTPHYREVIKQVVCLEQTGSTVDSIDIELLWDQLELPAPYGLDDVRNLLDSLYPNEKLPSDHPPIVADVLFME